MNVRNNPFREIGATMPKDTAEKSDSLRCSNSWSPRSVNDAVLIVYASNPRICRVVAITEDGRCVVDVGLYGGNTLKVEDSPGAWAKAGYFVQDYGGFLQSIFGAPEWRFVPSS
jgi:hypothetical protein